MYEFIQVGERSYYIDCPAKIGLFCANDTDVYLIDSGSDKEAGRKIRQILEKNNWTLKAIFNTHSHADHIGGNKYLQGRTGCKIYAPGTDCDFTRHPLSEPSFLYGGFPPKELHHKFLMAQESESEYLTENVLPEGLSMIPLPGHSFDMVGFQTSDGVIYLADCLTGRETLAKYQIEFIYDVAAFLETLEKVKTMDASLFIPAHAEPTSDIRPLAQINIDKTMEIAALIRTLCTAPKTFEALLREIFRHYDLNMNFDQYVLVGSTLRSYLSWMKNQGQLCFTFNDNEMLWKTEE